MSAIAQVIHWKLREVMEEYRIKSSELAEVMNLSTNSVANLRKSEMPRIDGNRLNQLVLSLNSLRQQGTKLITPSDLIAFSAAPSEMKLLEGR